MRRVRPYIPLEVRVQVAERQVLELSGQPLLDKLRASSEGCALRMRLMVLLGGLSVLMDDEVLQLDHDPALILRQYKVDRRKPPAAWYTPNANDPAYLTYRPLRDHGEKTFGRKADAEKTVTTKGSDIWLKSKFKRLEQPTKRPRAKIPARAKPWPKGRKLQGRPFPR